MLRSRLALLLAFALLSVNLLSFDFDGGAFEGKGIETAILYLPSDAEIAVDNGQKACATQTRLVAPGEGQSVSAFEVPFTLISKHAAPPLHVALPLPVLFIPNVCTPCVPLLHLSVPRGPPRAPTDLRSFCLRAPPLSLTPSA